MTVNETIEQAKTPSNDRILMSHEYASEAFDDNILRLELLHDGNSVLTTFNSKKEQTAITYFERGGVAHA